MRIGIDIDGVLTNVEQYVMDYFTKYCVDNNIDYCIGESNYKYYKAFNVEEKHENDFWDKYLESYVLNIECRPFASEIIKKLKNDGHEIYIITARWLSNRDDSIGENMRNVVRNWLSKNEVYYDKLIFSRASKERKVDEIKDNKIDLMIEDSPSNINELSNVVPVICYDAQYNKACNGDKIIRCYSWYDIYKTISNM